MINGAMNTQESALPTGWIAKHLKDYCDVVTSSLSYTDFKELEEETGADTVVVFGIKVSDMNLVGNETQIITSNLTKRISQITASKKTVPPETVVFPKRGAAIATNKKRLTTTWAVFDPNLIGVRARTALIPEFIYYWFLHFDLRRITDPGPTPQLNKKDLEPLLIPIPPIEEQYRIAHILSVIQTAIDQQKHLISLTRELKSTLMHKLFSEGLRGEKQKETEIGLAPESWEIVELEQVSEKPQYGFTDTAKNEGGTRFLRITDIQDFGVNWEQVPYCECPDNIIDKYLLKNGDLVFARIGATTGKSFVIQTPPKAVFASYLIRIRPNNKRLVPEFLAYYCQTKQYWKQIDAHKGNNLKGGVNAGILQQLILPLPAVDEQEEINNVLSCLDVKIKLSQNNVFLLEELFRTLLHQLMTGQIRVNDLELTQVSSGEMG